MRVCLLRIVPVLLTAILSGCSLLDYMQCGDAGVKDCYGFMCSHNICNGEEFNPITKKWGRRIYDCGMWGVVDAKHLETVCQDKKSKMYLMTFKQADDSGLVEWRY